MTARLAIADLEGRKLRGTAHLKLQGGFAWIYQAEDLPRLQLYERTIKGCRSRTWLVDGAPHDTLEAAIAAYNGEPMPEPPKRKISIAQQIEEIERELEQRRNVYPRLVSSGKLRQSIADFQVQRLETARDTLRWVAERELLIKQRLA